MSNAKTLLEVGDKIEERAMLRVKEDTQRMRVRQGWRSAEVIAVVDEPCEEGATTRVALIRRVDGDDITGWDALNHERWMSGLWRYAEETKDPMVTVCAECRQASCWYGEFMCSEAKTANVVQVPRSILETEGREHSRFWTDEAIANGGTHRRENTVGSAKHALD